jgi:phosphoglycerol transferase MdoB-like AlkP superfamily enzyme
LFYLLPRRKSPQRLRNMHLEIRLRDYPIVRVITAADYSSIYPRDQFNSRSINGARSERVGSFQAVLQNSLRSFFQFIRAGKQAGQARWLLFVVFYTVFANVPYWFASHEFGFLDHRGLFCLQFVTVGLIALVAPPILSSILLLSVIASDLLSAVSETYFLSIRECFLYATEFHAFSGARRVVSVTILLLALLLAASALFLRAVAVRKDDRLRTAACLLTFAVLILSTDLASIGSAKGSFTAPLRMSPALNGVSLKISHFPRLARISIFRLIRFEISDARIRAGERSSEASPHPVPSASAEALRLVDLAPGKSSKELPNLVVVLVESWGLAGDLPLRQALVQPYMQPALRARYDVVEGTVPFYGATMAGEARELCGNSFGFYLMDAPATKLKNCLPDRLAALGYHSLALHGMNGYLFRRSTWYRTIGFQEQWFNAQFKQQGLPDCMGTFVGTCDADIAKWIGRRLGANEPHPNFVHWMTLSSHLPVPVPSELSAGSPCLPALSLQPDSPLCSWYQLVTNVHQSVSELAMGDLSRPTVFVVVGDHAPPFNEPALLSRFSDSVVPYILLIPRTEHGSQDRMLAGSSLEPPGKVAKPSAQTP